MDKFNVKGDILKASYCKLIGEPVRIYDMPNLRVSGMYWRKDYFYLTGRECLIRMNEAGEMELLALDAEVLDFSISSPHSAIKIAVITDKGCLLITPAVKDMRLTGNFFAVDSGACFFCKAINR